MELNFPLEHDYNFPFNLIPFQAEQQQQQHLLIEFENVQWISLEARWNLACEVVANVVPWLSLWLHFWTLSTKWQSQTCSQRSIYNEHTITNTHTHASTLLQLSRRSPISDLAGSRIKRLGRQWCVLAGWQLTATCQVVREILQTTETRRLYYSLAQIQLQSSVWVRALKWSFHSASGHFLDLSGQLEAVQAIWLQLNFNWENSQVLRKKAQHPRACQLAWLHFGQIWMIPREYLSRVR